MAYARPLPPRLRPEPSEDSLDDDVDDDDWVGLAQRMSPSRHQSPAKTIPDSVDVFFGEEQEHGREMSMRADIRNYTSSEKVANTLVEWNKTTRNGDALAQAPADGFYDADERPFLDKINMLATNSRRARMTSLGSDSAAAGVANRVGRIRLRRDEETRREEQRRREREEEEAEAKKLAKMKKKNDKGGDKDKKKGGKSPGKSKSKSPSRLSGRKKVPGEMTPLDWQALDGTTPLGVPRPGADRDGSPPPVVDLTRGQGALEVRMQERQLQMEQHMMDRRVEGDTLNFTSVGITASQAALLGAFLMSNPAIQVVLFSGGAVNDEVAKTLVDALLEAGSVTAVDISDNRITANGMAELARVVSRQGRGEGALGIAEMVLCGNPKLLPPTGKGTLGIAELVLRGNRIGDRGAGYIADALMFDKKLQWLDVSGCGFENKGAGRLLDLLNENATLKDLDLSWNRLAGPEVVRGLEHCMPANRSLTRLDLSHCGLHEAGGVAVGHMVGENEGIRFLDISANNLGPATARALSEGLTYNAQSRIETLRMHDNPVTFAGGVDLVQAFFRTEGALKDLDVGTCAFHTPQGVRFNPERPNGNYRIDLAVEADRELIEELLRLWRMEGPHTWVKATREVTAVADKKKPPKKGEELPKVKKPFEYTADKGWPEAMPRKGVYDITIEVPKTPPQGAEAANEDRFLDLLVNMEREGASDQWKLSLLRVLCASSHLTSESACAVLDRFQYDDGKVWAAEEMFPRVVDIAHFSSLRDHMPPLSWEHLMGSIGALSHHVEGALTGHYCLNLASQLGRLVAIELQRCARAQVAAGTCPGLHNPCWRDVRIDGELQTKVCQYVEWMRPKEVMADGEVEHLQFVEAVHEIEQNAVKIDDEVKDHSGPPREVRSQRATDMETDIQEVLRASEWSAGDQDWSRVDLPQTGMLELDFLSFDFPEPISRKNAIHDYELEEFVALLGDFSAPFRLSTARDRLAAVAPAEAGIGPLSMLQRVAPHWSAGGKEADARNLSNRRIPDTALGFYVRERVLSCMDQQLDMGGEVRGALLEGVPSAHVPRVEQFTLVSAAAGEVVLKPGSLPDHVWLVMEGIVELVPGKEGKKGKKSRPATAPAGGKGKRGKKEPAPPVLLGPGEVVGCLDVAIEAALGHSAASRGDEEKKKGKTLMTRAKRFLGIKSHTFARLIRIQKDQVLRLCQANPMVYDNLRFRALEIHVSKVNEEHPVAAMPGWRRVHVEHWGNNATELPMGARDLLAADVRLQAAINVWRVLAAHYVIVSWQVIKLLKGPLAAASAVHRAELVVATSSRMVDRHNLSEVMRELSSSEQVMVGSRLGWINVLDRQRMGDILYTLDLTKPTEYSVARIIVSLAVRGGGLANLYDVHVNGQPVTTDETPRTWAVLSAGLPYLEMRFEGPGPGQMELYAAMTIQAQWRGVVEKRRWQRGRRKRVKRRVAANIIQAHWRIRMDRRRVSSNLAVMLRVKRVWLGLLKANKEANPNKWFVHDMQKRASQGVEQVQDYDD